MEGAFGPYTRWAIVFLILFVLFFCWSHPVKRKNLPPYPSVRIFPFIAPGADMSKNRLKRDLAAANEIFNPCGIAVVLGSKPITLIGEDLLFSNHHPVDFDNNPFQMIRLGVSATDLAVYYVGGEFNVDGESIGDTTFDCTMSNRGVIPIMRMIILTNGASVKQPVDYVKYTFAHEVLHALLIRPRGNTIDISDPSGPYLDPNGSVDPVHDNDPNNLLYPMPPQNPSITPEQCSVAHRSTLLKKITYVHNPINSHSLSKFYQSKKPKEV